MKSIVGIFAHPDDEAFGPGGTIAKLAQKMDVFTICVTNGDAGQNSFTGSEKELAEIRQKEQEESSIVLGVKKVFFLNYKDGSLSNNLYHEIAEKMQKILDEIQPEIVLTYEPRGVSGHIDHIAVSMIVSHLFEKSSYIAELWQYCLSEERRAVFGDYYIYVPPGYSKEEITRTEIVSEVWTKKLAAIQKHQSQQYDIKRRLVQLDTSPPEECFLVRKRLEF